MAGSLFCGAPAVPVLFYNKVMTLERGRTQRYSNAQLGHAQMNAAQMDSQEAGDEDESVERKIPAAGPQNNGSVRPRDGSVRSDHGSGRDLPADRGPAAWQL